MTGLEFHRSARSNLYGLRHPKSGTARLTLASPVNAKLAGLEIGDVVCARAGACWRADAGDGKCAPHSEAPWRRVGS
jgi:hypothetical protein